MCLELDANAKLGPQLIPGDPHETSPNGELLKSIILSNNLVICNSSKKCEGLYTRERKTINGYEKSIIDFFLICKDMFVFFEKMKIDADNALTKHSKKKDQVFVQKSDHHLLICHFNIKQNLFEPKKGNRQEMFNFNDPEGWIKYKKLTSENNLTKCFKGVNVNEEGRIWLKKLKKHTTSIF